MIQVLLLLALAQPPPNCSGEAARHVATANARAEALNLSGASDAFFTAAAIGCADADVAAHFIRGLLAAREAYRFGGSPESLEPVKQAIVGLETRGAKDRGIPEVWRFLLQAAAAAAQSERDEMALLLEHAIQLEVIQLEAGERRIPGVTAHELAGDLFLQVHRYDDARRAYARAAARLGVTPRVRLGYARTAARLKEIPGACLEYRALLSWWGARAEAPPEIVEARAFVGRPACQRPASQR